MTMTPRRRRGAALAAAFSSAALALSACGSASNASDNDSNNAAPTTRTVKADNGMITVPANPQRVVTINGTNQPFIDLGGKPVGTSPNNNLEDLPKDQQATFKAATDIGAQEPDLEKIASLKPDLILIQDVDAGFKKIEKQLQSIAPTAFWRLQTEWKTMADGIAEAGNVTAKLDEQKAAFKQRVSGIQKKYGTLIDSTKFVNIGRWPSSDPGQFAIADIGCVEVATDDVGINFVKAAAGKDPLGWTSLPFEKLADLSKYDVITYDVDANGKPKKPFEPVLETNTWKALPAVKSGRALGIFCPGNGSYGQVNRYLESLDSALATLPAKE